MVTTFWTPFMSSFVSNEYLKKQILYNNIIKYINIYIICNIRKFMLGCIESIRYIGEFKIFCLLNLYNLVPGRKKFYGAF